MDCKESNVAAAKTIRDAIVKFASDESALDNFESYLSHHFDVWLKTYAYCPSCMASEFESFANINED